VPVEEIASETNAYNLNLTRYIDSSEPEDIQDLEAHLRGGIPERDVDLLEAYWKVLPSLRADLFAAGDRDGYCEACVEQAAVEPTIVGHPGYVSFKETVQATFSEWAAAHRATLLEFAEGALPRAVVRQLSEDLLERFRPLPLIGGYDVYQRLMDYWADVMQDDFYLIAAEGWVGATRPRPAIDDKAKKIKETPDLVIAKRKYKTDLVPPALLVARFFAEEQAEIERLEEERAGPARDLEEFVEEHSGDEGLLEEALNEKGAATKKSAQARLKLIRDDPANAEETQVVRRVLDLIEADSAAGKAAKDTQAALDLAVFEKYDELSENEIKDIVIDDKWFAALGAAVEGELQRLTEALADRVRVLEDRYAMTVGELEDETDELTEKVRGHLLEMGFAWA
jgi:type I restriction enzyme M protein